MDNNCHRMGRVGKLKVKKKFLESDSWGELKGVPKKFNKKSRKTQKFSQKPEIDLNSQNLSKRQREIIKRRLRRNKQKTCFACRNTGHLLSDCPFKQDKEIDSKSEDKICYICGSPDHTSTKCHLKIKSGEGSTFQFAKCFICKEMGHISKQCFQNSNGVYPNGGACRFCGSKEHLKGQCPQRIKRGTMDKEEEFLEMHEGRDESRDEVVTKTKNEKMHKKQEHKIVYF